MPLFSVLRSPTAEVVVKPPFKIEIPVDAHLLPDCPTPEELAAEKRSNLSTPRVPKSPAELRKAEERGARLRAAYVEAVQARAARENQRAAEVKARRLRAEENARRRIEERLHASAKRDTILDEEKKQAKMSKARAKVARAEEARAARQAMARARDEKLASASDRVEESSRRAAYLIQETSARNANLVKRALEVVAANHRAQAESAAVASSRLAARIDAAAERRNDALDAALPRTAMSRMELAKAELARLAIERMEKKMLLDLSLAAANIRRDQKLEHIVEKARANLSRVESASEVRAEAAAMVDATRRCLFAKLNAASVNANVKIAERSRKAAKEMPALSFEIPLRHIELGMPVKPLRKSLVRRLHFKRSMPWKPVNDDQLASRQAFATAKRVAFAHMDIAATMAARNRRLLRAASLRECIHNRAEAGAARAASFISRRVHAASAMNSRVRAAAVRRASAAASAKKAHQQKALREVVAAGQRAARLLLVSSNDVEAGRTNIVHVRRGMLDAMREARAQTLHLRSLVAASKRSHALMQRSARAQMSALPYGTPAKITHAGTIELQPKARRAKPLCARGLDAAPPESIFMPRSQPESPRPPVSIKCAFPNDSAFRKVEAAVRDISVISDAELKQMHAHAVAAIDDSTQDEARGSGAERDSLASLEAWQVI